MPTIITMTPQDEALFEALVARYSGNSVGFDATDICCDVREDQRLLAALQRVGIGSRPYKVSHDGMRPGSLPLRNRPKILRWLQGHEGATVSGFLFEKITYGYSPSFRFASAFELFNRRNSHRLEQALGSTRHRA